MVLLVMPRPLNVGQTYRAEKSVLQGVVAPAWPTTGKPRKLMFWLTSSIGISKLAVFVRLKISKVNFRVERSVICMVLISEMSARLCQVCRKILRWPLAMKFVSYGSFAGMAPFKSTSFSKGSPKHDRLNGGKPGVAPEAPVSACLGVQPERGTIGLVMPSFTP